ncbi:hypothetical protein TCON_1593 [Astathelohania contejeani]|uniref:Transmembrane protein n=1 Tax=Astathelohania contejeani TaxID=164912 RepID=A0ABQ7HYI2_9MICR|nr:hypothetical protein TCON_1593 [Thelohania contejeani]
MKYDLPYFCPCFSLRLWLGTIFCPCFLSSSVYGRIFKNKRFSIFGFIFIPFSAYGIRRFVQSRLMYDENYEISAAKSVCYCHSLTQDIHEMQIRRIGIYKFVEEPDLEESTDVP